jgi:LmbE family N-acetylglucosaminyl deacetylase
LLGIASHVNWRRQDWDIEVNNAMYRAVIEEIRAFRPDAVFTHAYGDYHDHRNVHRAVSEGRKASQAQHRLGAYRYPGE